jgi:hypothetical protein
MPTKQSIGQLKAACKLALLCRGFCQDTIQKEGTTLESENIGYDKQHVCSLGRDQ